ncbi:hypothetical protein, partial [Methanobrevibacter arboriphilus]|uniref:hypothetical protein n=1 Tax=Methanobrevibacter arboriphilus TaxID=39441 RepID=UPI001E5C3006
KFYIKCLFIKFYNLKIIMFPDFIYASFWGGFIGTFSLIIGSVLGYYFNIPKKYWLHLQYLVQEF